ncbi:hypothetical protein ADUPG1_011924, partial [Aduncisulcus paluster]
ETQTKLDLALEKEVKMKSNIDSLTSKLQAASKKKKEFKSMYDCLLKEKKDLTDQSKRYHDAISQMTQEMERTGQQIEEEREEMALEREGIALKLEKLKERETEFENFDKEREHFATELSRQSSISEGYSKKLKHFEKRIAQLQRQKASDCLAMVREDISQMEVKDATSLDDYRERLSSFKNACIRISGEITSNMKLIYQKLQSPQHPSVSMSDLKPLFESAKSLITLFQPHHSFISVLIESNQKIRQESLELKKDVIRLGVICDSKLGYDEKKVEEMEKKTEQQEILIKELEEKLSEFQVAQDLLLAEKVRIETEQKEDRSTHHSVVSDLLSAQSRLSHEREMLQSDIRKMKEDIDALHEELDRERDLSRRAQHHLSLKKEKEDRRYLSGIKKTSRGKSSSAPSQYQKPRRNYLIDPKYTQEGPKRMSQAPDKQVPPPHPMSKSFPVSPIAKFRQEVSKPTQVSSLGSPPSSIYSIDTRLNPAEESASSLASSSPGASGSSQGSDNEEQQEGRAHIVFTCLSEGSVPKEWVKLWPQPPVVEQGDTSVPLHVPVLSPASFIHTLGKCILNICNIARDKNPSSFCLASLPHPRGFIDAMVQRAARLMHEPLDNVQACLFHPLLEKEAEKIQERYSSLAPILSLVNSFILIGCKSEGGSIVLGEGGDLIL